MSGLVARGISWTRTNRLGAIMALAAAYVMGGKLGQFLAPPASWAVAIWPAAGIALGVLVCWGTRLWPGVALGSVVYSAATYFQLPSSPGPIRMFVLALIIGLGTAAQACLAAFLVRPHLGTPPRLRDKRVVARFLLLAGPVASLVSATTACLGMAAVGQSALATLPGQWWTWWFGDTIGAVAFAPLVILLAAKSDAQHERAVLARANDDLAAALRAQEVLMRELQHRVKNNMQVIASLFSLQARYLRDARHREIFERSRNRVLSIAMAHEKLYGSKDLSRIDFSAYVRGLVDHLHGTLDGGQAIALQTDIQPMTLPVDLAIPCGLVINELVTNAFQHAFPDGRRGTIRVKLSAESPQHCMVSVEDDGVGLPGHIDLGKTESLGLDLVSILTTQIGAVIQVSREPGTRFHLSFKSTKS